MKICNLCFQSMAAWHPQRSLLIAKPAANEDLDVLSWKTVQKPRSKLLTDTTSKAVHCASTKHRAKNALAAADVQVAAVVAVDASKAPFAAN